MNIDEMTIGEAREIAKVFCGRIDNRDGTFSEPVRRKHGFEEGKSYFVRTVTNHYLGKVVEITDLSIVMEHCVWVADDGRFHKLMKGEWDSNSEREPYPKEKRVQVFFGGMLDAVEWTGEIPEAEK